ncbi:hypothetical protein MUN81_15875 [Hymenobacter sp. 5317J-9]|uniref:hypothetical protein n=1 Tax=Hymenobacter sp. 5317J-9 TaxID=2932250 RepID=UPI001FD6E090|nr:hypothetical protein [Hymenobacter sp. 5317J-9]UOQ96714.1 hypothetical protein MUN81_15875 [Hymenobacter sp. 5317J-9]
MMSYKTWLLAVMLLWPMLGFGQSYEKEFGVAFAWEVKQVDEFIERFNNDEFSFIREYLKKNESTSALTRERMLKSLFNAKGTNWNYNEITAFIKQVNNAEKPQYLDLDSSNWYANVQCLVTNHGKPEKALLKLKIATLPDGSSKWVIADVSLPGQASAPAAANAGPRVRGPKPADAKASLNPMSHAIDFMNIDLVTKKPENIENFVDDAPDRSRSLDWFVGACLKNQLKVVRATSISYTFLQIKGWQIEVKQFHRQSLNSGWLISKLVKLS